MKRFTLTEKWDDPWFWELSPPAKLLWLFLCDHCDNSGVVDVSLKIASYKIGQTIEEKHLAELESRLHTLENGKRFIRSFIRFQYGTLSRDCKPHLPIISNLTRHGIDVSQIETYCKGYSNPNPVGINTHKEKEKDQEKEKEKERGKGIGIPPDLESVKLHAATIGLPETEAVRFHAYYESNGWRVGKNPMRSWKSAMVNWRGNWRERNGDSLPLGQTRDPRLEPNYVPPLE